MFLQKNFRLVLLLEKILNTYPNFVLTSIKSLFSFDTSFLFQVSILLETVVPVTKAPVHLDAGQHLGHLQEGIGPPHHDMKS